MGGLSEQVWKAVDEFVDRAAVRRYGDGFLDRSRCDRIVLPAVERILAAHNGGLAERIRDYADDMEHQRSCEWDCPTEIAQELRALAAPVPDSPPASHTQAWLDTADPAGADKPGPADSRDEVQGRIDGLDGAGCLPTGCTCSCHGLMGGAHVVPCCAYSGRPLPPPAARRDERGEACLCDGAEFYSAEKNRHRHPFLIHPDCPIHAPSPDPATRGDSEEGQGDG